MSSVSSLSMPIFAIGILIVIFMLYLTIRKFSENTKVNPVLLLAVMAILAVALYKFTPLKYKIGNLIDPKPKVVYIYDTDPRNNDFIKGDLSEFQLRRLDRLLSEEKRQGGLRLNSLRVNELSGNNSRINDAYDRWRKCKDMYRSYHKTVYPDERSRTLNERR